MVQEHGDIGVLELLGRSCLKLEKPQNGWCNWVGFHPLFISFYRQGPTLFCFFSLLIWMFPKIGRKNTKMDGEFIMKNPIKMEDLGIPLFLETFISSSQVLNCRGGNSAVSFREGIQIGPLEEKHLLGFC